MADINWPLPSGVFIDLINQNTNIVVITAKVSLLVKALFGKYGVTRDFYIYDDSISHLDKCNWIENFKAVQAIWGYVLLEDYYDNEEEIISSILIILKGEVVHLQYLKNEVVAFLVIKTLEGLESKIESLVSKGYKILDVNFRTKCALHAIQFIKKQFSELKVGASTN